MLHPQPHSRQASQTQIVKVKLLPRPQRFLARMGMEVGESKVHQTSCISRRPTLSLAPAALLHNPRHPSQSSPLTLMSRERSLLGAPNLQISPILAAWGLASMQGHICLLLGTPQQWSPSLTVRGVGGGVIFSFEAFYRG